MIFFGGFIQNNASICGRALDRLAKQKGEYENESNMEMDSAPAHQQ